MYNMYTYIPYINVTSGGIRCNKGTPVIKKVQPLPFYQRRNNERRKKTEVLTLDKYKSNPSLFIKGGTPKEGEKTNILI
jgi:hypothetical protein